MNISDGILYLDDGTPATFVAIPKSNYEPRMPNRVAVVIHATASKLPQYTVEGFKNASLRVSAHLLITRDGQAYQFVSFNDVAYHAGTFMNWHSIGIELDNLLMERSGVTITGGYRAAHFKNTTVKSWERFPDVQIDVLKKILRALMLAYGPLRLIGHEDIVGDKSDPGPAFPWGQVLESIYAGMDFPALPVEPVVNGKRYRVTWVGLNVRNKPTTDKSQIVGSLVKDDEVVVIGDIVNNWAQIGEGRYVYAGALKKI